ncbi:hypothetical protein [Nocardioides sp. YIM 152588]|uniref:hypothetical protein n=1 Tax=Nocardioides sp. YIM 152588 TaxID=3158259 RepID=UPI0032E51297
MNSISRRHVFGLAAGAAGAAAGVSTLGSARAATVTLARPRTSIRAVVPNGNTLIGMSSPARLWNQREREVGGGLRARRIFADLKDGPTSQLKRVQEAHAANMLPVISYKVGRDVNGAVRGNYNKVAAEAAKRLADFDKPTAVTFWHEPHSDMTPYQYVVASEQILPQFQLPRLKVGPILNGWLLERRADDLRDYAPDRLFRLWDWFGIDTYEAGTRSNPGVGKPAGRIPKMRQFVREAGFDHPIAVGEYNGYSAKSIADAGEALLSTSNVWFGCVWNATGERAYPLSGDRLRAFRQTLADPRAG